MKVAVVIFAYLRPEKFKNTLTSLSQNDKLSDFHYVCFQDGLRTQEDRVEHELVQSYWDDFIKKNNIKSSNLNLSKINLGLRQSIMGGITNVLSSFDAVIVLEDDLEFHSCFLTEMKELLHKYKDDRQIFHVNAWAPPTSGSPRTRLASTKMMFCWGWATWADKWQKFALQEDFQPKSINGINGLRGNFMGLSGLRRQLKLNDKGKIRTWAVYWYWYIYTSHKKCIGPTRSLIRNTGNDGTGENCSKIDSNNKSIFDGKIQFERPMLPRNNYTDKLYVFQVYKWLIVRNLLMIKSKLKRLIFK